MGKNRKNTPKVHESEEDKFISDSDEGAEEDMVSLENDDDGEDQGLEEEARIARDETDSEDDADNAEFLAHGVDLDLPEEDSADELDDDGSQDSELDDYYQELGIAAQKDWTKNDDGQQLYKKTKKKEGKKQVEEKKASDKTKIIEAMINRTREDPSYKTISRIVKIIKQVFNTPTAKDEAAALKASAKNAGQL